jgi:NADH:ubiquinone oxidoreductase, NADH-binding (51 kD) subunit
MTHPELLEITQREKSQRKKVVLRCCMAAGCMSLNSKGAKEQLDQAVAQAGLKDTVEVRGVGCMKLCCEGPLVQADPQNSLYVKVTPENAQSIIGALIGGKASVAQADPEAAFFKKQLSIVLANSGVVDPERIESYIAVDGYEALHHVLHEMLQKDVVDAITHSGLRGRGGAGFPTGLKWGTVAKSAGTKKYVICNADEGDPGAFMDRSVLESDPHSVIEGMAIAAYAVGADQGYIYVRAEYPLAINRLNIAIKQAKQMGLLGSGVFDSPFNLTIDLRIGAGAFVCGEETALMASVEGKRGTPRPRPRSRVCGDARR